MPSLRRAMRCAVRATRGTRVARAVVVLVALFAVTFAGPDDFAGAHTEVQEASPGPAETVAPGLSTVEVRFLDPVLPGVLLEVVGPDGAAVAGLREPEVDPSGLDTAVTFAPLGVGTYEVRLRFVAEDGDAQSERYTFRVAESAAPARGSAVDRRVLAAIAAAIAGAGVAVIVVRGRRTSGDDAHGSGR